MLHISADEQQERLLARLDDPTKYWKFNPGDIDERALWPAYREAYEIALERTNTDVAPVVRRPGDQQVVPQPRHRPAAARGPAAISTRSGRPPTSTSSRAEATAGRRGAGRVIVPRLPTVAVTRYVTPLREGGSLPGHRRGRRPRHLRLQVPRRRPGPPGAGRRGHRRRAGPADRAAHAAAGRPRARPPRSPATRPTRRSRTCSTPAPGSTSASTSCPARSATTATLAAPSAEAGRDALARRASRQRRPLAGATPTCCSGTATSG